MKEKEFEPAKIISKPDAKPTEKDVSPASSKTTEAEPVGNEALVQAEPNAEQETNGDSWEGIIDRFTGKSKSTVVWPTLIIFSRTACLAACTRPPSIRSQKISKG